MCKRAAGVLPPQKSLRVNLALKRDKRYDNAEFIAAFFSSR